MKNNRHGSAVLTLPSDTDILITRVFDAPARLVFKALTTAELVKQWWGFATSEWLECRHDFRVGGKWRNLIRERGMEVGFNGEYKEIDPPHRLVATEAYEGAPDAPPSVVTTTLEEVDGVTTMTVLCQYASMEIRDAVISSGMERGMQVSYDRLEDLVRAS